MQSWIGSFRLISSGPYVTAGVLTNSSVPINLTSAISDEIGCHMANRCHSTPKVIALESLGFWGEKKQAKSNLKQLDEVEFQAVTRLPVGLLIPTLI